MPNMKLLRLDFPPAGEKCAKPRCSRSLTRRCYVAENNGREIFFGSSCVKDYFDETTIKSVPDLTRRDSSALREQTTGRGAGITGVGAARESSPAKIAGEYLWLRFGKLASFCTAPVLACPEIAPLFDKLKGGGSLTESEILSVLHITQVAPPELSANNLLDVYAASRQLDERLVEIRKAVARHRQKQQSIQSSARNDVKALQVATKKLNDTESYLGWLESIKISLGKYLRLSPKQLDGARLILPKSAFAWHDK